MKPALFDYVAPGSLQEAVAALVADDMARPLAGGQSLIPTLNFRIANPTRLVDLRNLAELRALRVEGDVIRIGAMTRHRELETSDEVHAANPLIREVMGNVAHIVIRNRGTIGGSLAHADAAAELPAFLLAMDGEVVATGPNGERTIAADDLFQFHMMTTLEQGEVLTEIRIPTMPAGSGGAFLEFARRRGDYALVGICSMVTLDRSGCCDKVRIAACGVGPRAMRLTEAEAALTGAEPSGDALDAAARAAADGIDPPDDVHGSKAYRKHLAGVLVKRTVSAAAARANEGA